MKITIKHEPIYNNIYRDSNYELNCIIKNSDEADATETLYMCMKAMLIEGYPLKSILQAMYDISDVESFENNIELDKSEDE